MISTAIRLVLLGVLGIVRPIVVRLDTKWPRWLLYAAQLILGLNTALWGLWGLTQAANTINIIGRAPIFWTATLLGAVLELALPALLSWPPGWSGVSSVPWTRLSSTERRPSHIA